MPSNLAACTILPPVWAMAEVILDFSKLLSSNRKFMWTLLAGVSSLRLSGVIPNYAY